MLERSHLSRVPPGAAAQLVVCYYRTPATCSHCGSEKGTAAAAAAAADADGSNLFDLSGKRHLTVARVDRATISIADARQRYRPQTHRRLQHSPYHPRSL